MKHLKNYLAKSNENMRKEIISFIKRKSKISGNALKTLNKFLDDLSVCHLCFG